MSQRTLRISALATLLLVMGGVSAQADEIFTVRIENVSAKDALKLSNGKTEPVGVAPVLYVIHTNRAPLFTSGDFYITKWFTVTERSRSPSSAVSSSAVTSR